MNKRVGFLQDNQGNESAVRLMSLISLLSAIAFSGYTLVNAERVGKAGSDISFAFLFASFGGKISQKIVEEKKLS